MRQLLAGLLVILVTGIISGTAGAGVYVLFSQSSFESAFITCVPVGIGFAAFLRLWKRIS